MNPASYQSWSLHFLVHQELIDALDLRILADKAHRPRHTQRALGLNARTHGDRRDVRKSSGVGTAPAEEPSRRSSIFLERQKVFVLPFIIAFSISFALSSASPEDVLQRLRMSARLSSTASRFFFMDHLFTGSFGTEAPLYFCSSTGGTIRVYFFSSSGVLV